MDVVTARSTHPPVAGPDGWTVAWQPRRDPRLRLFCLPHTGGGAVTYRTWAGWLPPDVELVAIRLPGRESRRREPPYTRAEDLVPALVTALAPWLDRPHAWFGHSMGALLAFEACRELRRRGAPSPEALLVSGRGAPHLAPRLRPVHDAPVAAVVARLRELAGTPEELLADPSVLATLLPTLRADFAVAETYRMRPEPPLSCPVAVFGGLADPVADSVELHAWRLHTTGPCTVHRFGGGHFFLHDREAQVPALIAGMLARVAAR